MERVKREIFLSPSFERVKKSIPDFDLLVDQVIVPIEGDIIKENLGMRAEDRELIINKIHVIINCAASVDFNERLKDALNINYFGCLRMLELASQCRRIEIFTHVSTCYVNCDKKGYIQERIYDEVGSSEDIISKVMKMTPEE